MSIMPKLLVLLVAAALPAAEPVAAKPAPTTPNGSCPPYSGR
jgi:hypothetical protein